MTSKWYRVVEVRGQGYGTVSPEDWAAMSEIFHERVKVLQLCDSQEGATTVYEHLVRVNGDSEWQDRNDIHQAHGQWWEDTGLVVDGVQLYAPADKSLPVIEVEIPSELYTLADILSRLPPDRARAETRALDWCCENYVIQ